MEENKKTSKEILPESEREFLRMPSKGSNLTDKLFLALEAAEREVEEKGGVIIHLNGVFASAKGLIKEQESEISSLKREIEELKRDKNTLFQKLITNS